MNKSNFNQESNKIEDPEDKEDSIGIMTGEKVVSEVKEEEMIEMIIEDNIGEIRNTTIEEKIEKTKEKTEITEITEVTEITEITEITEELIKDVITEEMTEETTEETTDNKDQEEIMIVITIEKVETIKPEVVIDTEMKNVVVSNKKEDKENQC